VLEDVAHPGALVLGHAAPRNARLLVRAGVLLEGGDEASSAVGEAGELEGREILELAEVDAQTDHRRNA